MNELITKDNITFVIALLGFILSTGQIIVGIYKNRTHFNISVLNLEIAHRNDFEYYIYTVIIQNLSSAPLSITQIHFNGVCNLIQHQYVGVRSFPCSTMDNSRKEELILSADFPIDLAPHASILTHIAFDFYNKDTAPNPKSMITFLVTTTKKSKTFTMSAPEIHPNPYRLR